mgnify:CR=1 FL=1
MALSQASEQSAPRAEAPGGPTLTDILLAMTSSREALATTIDNLSTGMGILRDVHRRLEERVTTTEREFAVVPPGLITMKEGLTEVENKIRTLETRAEDAENTSQRNNIRGIGVLERAEKGQIVDFLEQWL